MSSNRLKLNPTETEFMWVSMSSRSYLIDRWAIAVSGADIKPLTCVKLFGVLIDNDLWLESQVNKTVSTGFCQLWQIKAIRKCLPADAVKSLVSGFMVSYFDYCNGNYANLSGFHLDRLPSVLNAGARLIFRASRFEHIIKLGIVNLHMSQILKFVDNTFSYSSIMQEKKQKT